MAQDLRFNVAISSAKEDGWIAKDLSSLLKWLGFSVYCHLHEPEVARGFLEEKLGDIYSDSCLNIIIWSRAYSQRPRDSIVSYARRCLATRHVYKGDAESLLILRADETPVESDLNSVLAHTLQERGLVGIQAFVIERLKSLWSFDTSSGLLTHPPGTEQERGPLQSCSFTIHPEYQSAPLNRWENLADVRIRSNDIPLKRGVIPFMILSGLAIPFLRNSSLLKVDPKLLHLKRRATINFLQHRLGRSLDGVWFLRKKETVEYPLVYCSIYDEFLNKSFQRESSK